MSNSFKIDLKTVKSFKQHLAVLVGTYFYSGLLPKAPGTWGTIAALPLVYFLNSTSHTLIFACISLLFFLGIWACFQIQKTYQINDHQSIVIDEVVGIAIGASMVGQNHSWLFVSFLLFRFFDITKIPPVNFFDLLSKKSKNPWISAAGVMLDDVIAGFQTLLTIFFIRKFWDNFF